MSDFYHSCGKELLYGRSHVADFSNPATCELAARLLNEHDTPQPLPLFDRLECNVQRQSDEMFCATCSLRWDINDFDRPECPNQVK